MPIFRKGSPSAKKERKKTARVWENGGSKKDSTTLDYSNSVGNDDDCNGIRKEEREEVENLVSLSLQKDVYILS